MRRHSDPNSVDRTLWPVVHEHGVMSNSGLPINFQWSTCYLLETIYKAVWRFQLWPPLQCFQSATIVCSDFCKSMLGLDFSLSRIFFCSRMRKINTSVGQHFFRQSTTERESWKETCNIANSFIVQVLSIYDLRANIQVFIPFCNTNFGTHLLAKECFLLLCLLCREIMIKI